MYHFVLFYCDMDTLGHEAKRKGWTVIQRRFEGEISFERNWNEYVKGFGKLDGEHWKGLENIFAITRQESSETHLQGYRPPRLRFDFEDWDGITAYTERAVFLVSGAVGQYGIPVLGKMYGNATSPNGGVSFFTSVFSTVDYDNTERNCPLLFKGAWWFGHGCGLSNLNGPYPEQNSLMGEHNIYWRGWIYVNPQKTALRRVSMKIQY